MFGINNEGGFVLLTGDVGTGKTTACRRLLETLPEGAEVAFILNPELSVVELLVSICREFGISPPEGPATNQTLVSSIHDYLLGVNARGRRAILILEEAQNLKPAGLIFGRLGDRRFPLRPLAHDTLLNLWHIEVKPGNLCEQAGNHGLRCLQGRWVKRPPWSSGRRPGASHPRKSTGPGQANTCCSGGYPPYYQGEVKPGSRGPMVTWLNRHLALTQGRTPPAETDPEYDQTLIREVKRFQLAAGLVPDGIVGPMTIMPLSPATNNGDPVLRDGKGSL